MQHVILADSRLPLRPDQLTRDELVAHGLPLPFRELQGGAVLGRRLRRLYRLRRLSD